MAVLRFHGFTGGGQISIWLGRVHTAEGRPHGIFTDRTRPDAEFSRRAGFEQLVCSALV